MGKNTSFSIGEHFSGFIEAQVSEGRYSSASDVVRAALRLLEEQEAKFAALRSALIEGEDNGDQQPQRPRHLDCGQPTQRQFAWVAIR